MPGRRYKSRDADYRTIIKDLKNDTLPGAILLYGRESYLIRWSISEIEKKYTDEQGRAFDFTEIDGSAADSARPVTEACEMLPFMSAKKVVLVTGLEKNSACLEGIREYLPGIPDTTILVMTAADEEGINESFRRSVNESGRVYKFDKLSKDVLGGFIKKHLKENGADFIDEIIPAFIDISGYYDRDSDYTLDNIMNDIRKLSAYGGRIETPDLVSIVTGNDERNNFAFTDALSDGNREEALRILWAALSHGGNEFSLLGLICSQFETMMLIRETQEAGKGTAWLEKNLKINGYRIRRLLEPASHYTSDELKRILLKAYEIDRKVKTGVMDARLGLELFVAEV